MIKYSEQCFQKVRQNFPNLYYKPTENVIAGKLDISAYCYKSNSGQWQIECCDHKDCLKSAYDIEIHLNKPGGAGLPSVFEVGGRIKKVMREMKCKEKQDAHLFPNDRCCLGLTDNKELSLCSFINFLVFPFFVWQYYYETYRKIPPWGEHSHCIESANMEYKEDISALKPGDLCLCGSARRCEECCRQDYGEHRN